MSKVRIASLISVLAMGAEAFGGVGISASADSLPTPVWSSGFENVVLSGDKVTGVTAENGTAEVAEYGDDGYDMTIVKSYNGTRALRINKRDYLHLLKNDGTAPVTGADQGITVNYWVKVYSGTTSWGFFSIKDGVAASGNKRYYFGLIDNTNNLRWESQNGENTAVAGSTDLSDWHMVTVTYGQNGSYSYVDGTLLGSQSGAYPYGSLSDILGSDPSAYIGYASAWGEHADIAVDDYSIYNTQLTTDQISEIYTQATNKPSGVYLDGSKVSGFDTASDSVMSDTSGGTHNIVVYTDDQTSKNTWLQNNGISLSVKNDTAGSKLTQQSSNPIFRVSASNAMLNIGDSNADHTDEITAFALDGNGKGRGVDMQGSGSSTNIYNGTIIENGRDSRGGGIDNKLGTVNIYGGIIRNNTAAGNSGGGGISVLGRGNVNIYGGLITANSSEVKRGGGVAVTENGVVHMSGGTITKNDGYDVYVGNNNFYMSGSAYAGNVYLTEGKYINVESAFTTEQGHGIIKPANYEEGTVVVKYANGVTPRTSDFYVMSDAQQAYTLAVQGQDLVLEKCERTYIQSLYETACAYPTVQEGAEYIKNELSIVNSEGLTENVELPVATTAEDGFSITWTSDNSDVITSNGVITRPEKGKASAVLTATIVFKGITITRDITVVVDGYDPLDYTLEISDEKGVDINDKLYGLFFEDINFSADGGIYAEMVENRSFESIEVHSDFTTNFDGLDKWSSNDSMVLKDNGGLNETNPHYLEFTGTSFSNAAYDGIYMEAGKKYNVSFWAKSNNYDGSITVSAGDNSVEVAANGVSSGWTKYEAELTASKTVRKVPLTVTLSKNGTVAFDMISVMPEDAVYGIFRKDLVEKLKDLKPGFLRFPGGCIVEGGTIDNYYDWKDTIGSIEERKQNWNKWGSYGGKASNYNQTYGVGYYEYFLLCEYLGCAPMPILNVGLACQNIYPNLGSQMYPIGSNEFNQLVQDALDLVEFANSTDFEHSKWAAIRRDMGHPEPFGLEMIGIGNEQWDTGESKYYERYSIFEQAIHEKYPEMKLIGCSMRDNKQVWNWIKNSDSKNPNYMYAVDEHAYESAEWFFENADHFDSYDRTTNTKVFYGEFAARTSVRGNRPNTLDSALSIAACMTGLERNADIVDMASYAPLFARAGYTQWTPDMIYFDDVTSYGTPEYYVQKLFGTNLGSYTLRSDLIEEGVAKDVYQTVSYDENSGDVIIKLVNAGTDTKLIDIDMDDDFSVRSGIEAEVNVLTGSDLTDMNNWDNQEHVSIEETVMNVSDTFRYEIPAISAVVIRINVEDESDDAIAIGTTANGETVYIHNEEEFRTATSSGGKLVGGTVELKGADIALTERWYPENITLTGNGSITMVKNVWACQPHGTYFTVDGQINIKAAEDMGDQRGDMALGAKPFEVSKLTMTIKGGATVDGIETENGAELIVDNAKVNKIMTYASSEQNIESHSDITLRNGAQVSELLYAIESDAVSIADGVKVSTIDIYSTKPWAKLEEAMWEVTSGEKTGYSANGNVLTHGNTTIYGYKAMLNGCEGIEFDKVKSSVRTTDNKGGDAAFSAAYITDTTSIFYVISEKELNTNASFIVIE